MIDESELSGLANEAFLESSHLIKKSGGANPKSMPDAVNQKYKKINMLAKDLVNQLKGLSDVEKKNIEVEFCIFSGAQTLPLLAYLVNGEHNSLELAPLLASAYSESGRNDLFKTLSFFAECPKAENIKFPKGEYRAFMYTLCYKYAKRYYIGRFANQIDVDNYLENGNFLEVGIKDIKTSLLNEAAKIISIDIDDVGVRREEIRRNLSRTFDEIYFAAIKDAYFDSCSNIAKK